MAAKKRPADTSAAGTSAVKKPAVGVAGQKATLVVYSKAINDEIGINTLEGEYTEAGANHGKKCFKRTKVPAGVEDITVFMYYWDKRDGADFSGWWFGDQVGGSQVWSRCEQDSVVPPKTGWRIPWDGEVQADLVVEPRKASAKPGPNSAPGVVQEAKAEKEEEANDTSAATQAEADERAQRATDRVVLVEIEATQALESARAMLEGEVTEDNVKVVEELLEAQLKALAEANKVLSADIMDARKSAPKAVTALSKLSPRVRSVQASIAQEIKAGKQLWAKKKQEQEDNVKRAVAEEKLMLAEQRDAKALEDALPEAMEVVTQAEELFDSVVAAAGPLAGDAGDEMNDFAAAAIKETEAAVMKAQTGIKQSKVHINQKLAAAKQYAPEARKVALAEFTALQEKLNELQKKTAPYMRVRKDFEQKAEAKKIMAEVSKKVGEAELEAEKVVSVLSGTKPGVDEVSAAEASVPPAMNGVVTAIKAVEQKLAVAQGALKTELTHMLERAKESKKKIDDFKVQLRSQAEGIQLQAIMKTGTEKAQAAEDALLKTTEAESPFLKGLELLPLEETTAAITDCKEAATAADAAVGKARSFFKAKSVVIKCFPDAVRATAMEDVAQLQNRVEAVAEKLAKFQKEITSRETKSLLREVTQKVLDAEAKLQRTTDVAAPLRADPPEEDVDKIRTATEQTLEAEKAAAVACAESRKVLMTKLKEGKGIEAPQYQAELQKLQSRLNAMQQELSKQRKFALQGEKLWRSKVVVQEKEEAMKTVEQEVEKAEILTTPLGDERPSDDHIRSMDAAVAAVQEKVKEITKALDAVKATVQGAVKTQLTGIQDRVKKAQSKIDEMKETTREQSERVHCDTILKQAREKLDAVDECFKKCSEAEVPYLKGIEVLPLEEAMKAVADCEAAAAEVQQANAEARQFLIEKEAEVRKFVEVVSKVGVKDLKALAQRGAQTSEKLAQFKKDTDGRRKTMMQQQASAKVNEAEEAVKKMTESAAEFSKKEQSSNDEISPEAAHEMCEKFGEAERAAQEKLDGARQFLTDRQRESRKEKKPQEDAQEVSKLVSRINALQVELAKAKAVASEHEQKFVAKMLMQEANDNMKALEAEIEKVSEEAAPLMVEGGKRFIVASMIRLVLEALKDHMAKNALSVEDFFAKVGPGAAEGKASEAEFAAFLEGVPELCSRPDLAFSAEQRTAIFAQVDADGDGSLSKEDFVELFHDRYVCVHGISVTDGFDIGTSKTLDKLEVDEVVQTLGEPRTHETLGMMRVEVKTMKDGTKGWVTMQGNQGKVYLSLFTSYAAFIKGLDKVFTVAKSSASKVNEYINSKSKELNRCEKGPLSEVKGELAKLRPKVSVLQAKLDQLKKRLEEGKKEHTKREELERKKMEDKKESKAASIILKVITEKVESAEAGLKKLEEAAGPLVGSDAVINSVAEPITVQEAAKASAGAMEGSVSEAKTCLQAHEVKVAKATKGPWFDAKQDMKKLKQRVLTAEKRSAEIVQGCQEACDALAEAKLGQVAAALRASIQARGISTETLFGELADKEEHITESAFFSHIDKLEGLSLSAEHKRLLLRDAGAAGFTRRAFFDLVERYYKCVKEIAVTGEFDIRTSATLRKLEVGELVEVVEGPKSDEGLGVMRVRAKAMADGVVGWITATGNHGTPFLVEAPKPCLHATAEVSMQEDFNSESGEIRTVKAFEVLELLEGPRKEVLGNAMRAKGKVVSDGTIGWFTTKTRQGADCVQPGKSTYVCTSNIALTDNIDIKNCKVVRKLSKGEGLTVLEGPVEDENTKVPRIKARASLDGAEGWVTVRGNAGSVYAEESGRQIVVCRSTPLQTGFASNSSTTRTLAEEEVLEVLEGPTEEVTEVPLRLRARASTDGKVGWVTLRKDVLHPWSGKYRCVAATTMHDALSPESAGTVRKLEAGEEVELLEGPRLEAAFGVMRVRGRAAKDGAVGWVTIAGNQGKPFLEAVKQL